MRTMHRMPGERFPHRIDSDNYAPVNSRTSEALPRQAIFKAFDLDRVKNVRIVENRHLENRLTLLKPLHAGKQ